MFIVKLESIYPVNIIFHSREAYWVANFTASTRSQRRDTPKCPGSSTIANDTRSTGIGSIAHVPSLVQTDYVIRDDAVDSIAVRIGDDGSTNEVSVKIVEADGVTHLKNVSR